MNKILVAVSDRKEQHVIEEILYDIVNTNCAELLFVFTEAQAIEIVERERPQLIFIDEKLLHEDLWQGARGRVVVLREKEEQIRKGEEYLLKPLKREMMVEKCDQVLDLQKKGGTLFSL